MKSGSQYNMMFTVVQSVVPRRSGVPDNGSCFPP